jgi:hypothetical protein
MIDEPWIAALWILLVIIIFVSDGIGRTPARKADKEPKP